MLLGLFCLRLACGLLGCLLLIPSTVSPRFFRAHLLIVLGLTTVVAVMMRQEVGAWLWLALGAGALITFSGSVAWSLEGAPTGRFLIVLGMLTMLAALGLAVRSTALGSDPVWFEVLDNLTSAALLGTATTAMLLGHSYLISPTMSLTPLFRLLTALFVATGLRMAVAGMWTIETDKSTLSNGAILWMLLRWGFGFVGPLVLGWMARESAKIRSTQSATGILYVVVIFCFLGELTSQLLLANSAGA